MSFAVEVEGNSQSAVLNGCIARRSPRRERRSIIRQIVFENWWEIK
jgi:hypothetical protein